MNKLDGANASSGFALPETGKRFSQSPQPSHETPAQESTLRSQVERSLQRYFPTPLVILGFLIGAISELNGFAPPGIHLWETQTRVRP